MSKERFEIGDIVKHCMLHDPEIIVDINNRGEILGKCIKENIISVEYCPAEDYTLISKGNKVKLKKNKTVSTKDYNLAVLQKVYNIILEDVPHIYQDRVLKFLDTEIKTYKEEKNYD